MELKLGASIKRLRTEKGFTQEELADYIGISYQAVSKWETNTTTPDITLLPRLAVFFGVTIDDLFSVDDSDHFERIDKMLRDEHTISDDNFIYADRFLKGILSENPNNVEAMKRIIELHGHRSNRDTLEMGRYAEQGILLSPMDQGLHGHLMNVRTQRQELDRLIAFYEPFVAKYPNNYIAIENLINTYIKNRYFDKAKALIAKSESRPIFKLFDGDIELLLGNQQKAISAWESAVQEYATDAWLLFEVAERFNKIAQYDTAIKYYEISYEKSHAPKWMDSLYARAFLFDKLSRYDEAIEMWEIIIKSLADDYGIKDGETADWPKRELEKLKAKK